MRSLNIYVRFNAFNFGHIVIVGKHVVYSGLRLGFCSFHGLSSVVSAIIGILARRGIRDYRNAFSLALYSASIAFSSGIVHLAGGYGAFNASTRSTPIRFINSSSKYSATVLAFEL